MMSRGRRYISRAITPLYVEDQLAETPSLDFDYSKFDFKDPEDYDYKSGAGLSPEVVERISQLKNESDWLRRFRLKSYDIFLRKPMPLWGGDLTNINFDKIYYYIKPSEKSMARSWDDVPASIRNTFEKLGIPEAERKFLAGVGAQYECLTGDTKIFTNPEGVVNIKDIHEGMYVYSFDEMTGELVKSRVRGVAYRGERVVYEVRVGTRVIKASTNHPFLTLRNVKRDGAQPGRYRLEWCYLSDLKVGDLAAVVKELPDVGVPYRLSFSYKKDHRYNTVTLPEYTSEDLMWFLGIYVGDGFIHREGGKARVEIAIPEDDEELRSEVVNVVKRIFSIDVASKDKYRITIYSTILADFISNIGFGESSESKSIPQWVFTLPHTQILEFIGGYLDSDGYVRGAHKNHNPVIISVNYGLLQQLRYLCSVCGISSSNIHEFESRHPHDKERKIKAYRLQLSGPIERIRCRSSKRLKRLTKRKYHHNYTSAKGTKFIKHTNKYIGFARIKSIKQLGIQPVYDIEVEGYHNFVAEGIVVHNSEVVYHNLRRDLERKGVIFVDPDTALRDYPELFKKHFGTVIPPDDNKFAALNSAVFSGGSFIYVPEGVEIDFPLQAYFRINAANAGQFERTLIIAEPYSRVHYIEGCLPSDEKVLKGDSLAAIQEIAPDDIVLNGEGEETLVQSTRVRDYEGELVEITPLSPANSFKLTPDHPVLAVKREWVKTMRRTRYRLPEASTEKLRRIQPMYIPAGQLKVGDFLVYPVNKEVEDSTDLNKDALTVLGYYLAEGSAFIHKKLNIPVVEFAFGADERDFLEELSSSIERFAGKKTSIIHQPRRNAVTVVTYSKEIYELCTREISGHSYDRRLSPRIMKLSPNKQRILLDAYLKGDGSVYGKGRMLVRSSTTSETLAFQLQEILARLGVFASIMIREGGEDRIMGRKITRKRQYVLAFYPKKRWSEVRLVGHNFLVPIRRIERKYYKGKVYNFEVLGRHNSYLVKGFAVHNCTAPIYSTESLHSAVVEIIAKKGAYVRYTTLQNWSRDVYNLVTKRAHAYEDATVEWVDANVGCLVPETKVFTNHDVRTIKDLEVGDVVYTLGPDFSIRTSRVIGKKINPPRPVYRLTTANHREITATDNHPFLTLSKEGRVYKVSWKTLRDLRGGELIAVAGLIPDRGEPHRIDFTPDTRSKPVKYPYETSEDLMWMLGFYLGDGYMDGNRVCFAIEERDPAAPRLVSLLNSFFGVEVTRRGNVIRVNSKNLVEFLRSLGFFGRAREKKLPYWVYRLPHSQKRSLIEGYIAADGYVRKGHRNISICSVNRKLLEDVKVLATSCGMNPLKVSKWTRRERKPLGKKMKTYAHYFLYFSDHTPLAEVYFVPILRIEPVGKRVTYDIEVEGTANFIAQGIIVHNSRVTMKYPSIYLLGKGAKAEILSVAFAGRGQQQDTGGKAVHLAPYTTSRITSKSVCRDGGRTSYRGLLHVGRGAKNVKSSVRCDALILDDRSRTDTYPYNEINEDDATVTHEASVGKIGEDQLFYLMSRGLKEQDALNMVVLGFLDTFTKTLPMEYAVEFNRLIELEMTGSVG